MANSQVIKVFKEPGVFTVPLNVFDLQVQFIAKRCITSNNGHLYGFKADGSLWKLEDGDFVPSEAPLKASDIEDEAGEILVGDESYRLLPDGMVYRETPEGLEAIGGHRFSPPQSIQYSIACRDGNQFSFDPAAGMFGALQGPPNSLIRVAYLG